MFCLIQRGQLYADGDGFPVVIHSYMDKRVRYRSRDNRLRSVCLSEFNSTFERLDHREYCQIKTELEREGHIRQLRTMRKSGNEKLS
ncbi:DUF4222 domain-containing protein [Salmonella enterica subsp. enterica serovar Bonariensis]|nr:DUF4222 domain-containing protein [Salmonella enterica subsp. enterica serovar Bonariensis]